MIIGRELVRHTNLVSIKFEAFYHVAKALRALKKLLQNFEMIPQTFKSLIEPFQVSSTSMNLSFPIKVLLVGTNSR
jgi:hypothetical protein